MKSRACCLLPPGSGENKKSVERGNIMLGKSLAVFLRLMRRRSVEVQLCAGPGADPSRPGCPDRKEKKPR